MFIQICFTNKKKYVKEYIRDVTYGKFGKVFDDDSKWILTSKVLSFLLDSNYRFCHKCLSPRVSSKE